jgi:NADH-quinone oxidoreductase subunit C
MTDTGLSSPLEELNCFLPQLLGRDYLSSHISKGELVVSVRRESIARVLMTLRDEPRCLFRLLMDVCGADYPERTERFEVVYHLLSLKFNLRLRVKVTVAEDVAVPTVTGVYSTASWFEREAWDLFGIFFAGHPDLRRLLTDYGFDGHPLRKDFPLTGYVELRYDPEQQRVVYEPVKLTQDYRNFDYVSPWEGMTGVQLPGDEKAAIPFGAAGDPKIASKP